MLWKQARVIFDQVVVFPPEQQVEVLGRLCGDQVILTEMVSELLHAYEPTQFGEGESAPLPNQIDQLQMACFLQRRCGPYRLIESIGQGGMGHVFLAERTDGELQHKVAIKFLHLGRGQDQQQRFLLERQMLANLKHPNICSLLDGNRTDDGTPYLVMENIEGVDLLSYCDRNRCTIRQRIELFLKVCDAVSHAHHS